MIMTNEHPITPPPELVEEWANDSVPMSANAISRDWERAFASRAALAQPEPQGPTDEEAQELFDATRVPIYAAPSLGMAEQIVGYEPVKPGRFARAVLSRFARPAIEPVPADELLAAYRAGAADAAIEPVAVSERLPGPEDCDAEGRCWWWIIDQPGELPHWIYCQLEVLSWTNFTAWLPHHALPVPQQEVE